MQHLASQLFLEKHCAGWQEVGAGMAGEECLGWNWCNENLVIALGVPLVPRVGLFLRETPQTPQLQKQRRNFHFLKQGCARGLDPTNWGNELQGCKVFLRMG